MRQKARWILEKLEASAAAPEAPAFLSGEKLPYGGRDLTLWVQGVAATASDLPEVSLERRRLNVAVPMGLDEEAQRGLVAEALMNWYAGRAQEQIGEQLARWLPVLGKSEVPAVQIRNQRRRWGSCSPKGVLRFNWRLAMLEPALVEYVVVHELAHLTHMNHSPAFWGLVAQHLPDVQGAAAAPQGDGGGTSSNLVVLATELKPEWDAHLALTVIPARAGIQKCLGRGCEIIAGKSGYRLSPV